MPHLMTLTVAAPSEEELIDAHEDIVRELESADNPTVIRLREQAAHNLKRLKSSNILTGTQMTPEQYAESRALTKEAVLKSMTMAELRASKSSEG